LLSYAAPEIEWMPAGPAAVERAVYRGHEEVANAYAAVWDTWDLFQFEGSQVRDLGDSVLWLGRVKVHGRASHVRSTRSSRLTGCCAAANWHESTFYVQSRHQDPPSSGGCRQGVAPRY